MKVALIHDHLTCKAGGEQVALTFHKAFPRAPIYTLAYDPAATFPEFKDCDVRTSWFQRITNNEQTLKKLFFPLGILAMRSIYIEGYDIVLISGTHCGKYVRFAPRTIVVSYTFTPFRLAWDPSSYAEYSTAKGLKKIALHIVTNLLLKIDFFYAKRVDYFLAMTAETKDRIVEAYKPRHQVNIINPPVNNIAKFVVNQDTDKEYYLVVSRLEFYKKVDLVVELFNRLNKRLIIVGRGSKEAELKAMNTSNLTEFRKDLSTDELNKLYENCRAFIFPQHEDYGLTALEANAAGRPVIAFNRGGIKDTQIPLRMEEMVSPLEKSNLGYCTAVFFDEQTTESLAEAIEAFETHYNVFNSNTIRRHAEKFDEKSFIEQIRTFVLNKVSP
jgi:glycosyltransferase involved in cell wall biosynthesis